MLLETLFFLFPCVTSLTLQPLHHPEPQILNGEDAQIGQFPWHVGLATFVGDSAANFCSGAIISENWIVTTALCIEGSDLVGIRAGALYSYDEPDGVMTGSPVYMVHQEFDSTTLRNDIGLVYVDPPLPFNENISSVALGDEELGAGVVATITGWGHSNHDDEDNHTFTLQYTTVTTIDNSDCQSVYGSDVVVPIVLCTTAGTSGQTPCFGDGGSPLVLDPDTNPTLIAIFIFTSSLGCDDYPAGYTRISYYRGWIRDKTGI